MIPEIMTNADDTRQPGRKIAKSHSLDEIVEPIEQGADFCESVLFARYGTIRRLFLGQQSVPACCTLAV